MLNLWMQFQINNVRLREFFKNKKTIPLKFLFLMTSLQSNMAKGRITAARPPLHSPYTLQSAPSYLLVKKSIKFEMKYVDRKDLHCYFLVCVQFNLHTIYSVYTVKYCALF